MARRWVTVGLLLTLLATAGCEERAASGGRTPPPRSDLPARVAALGDSITSGFGSCLVLAICERNSWATGTGARVNSHLKRIRAGRPTAEGWNVAQAGALAGQLAGQARRAVKQKPDYVTVQIGANDACRGSISQMTPVADFRARVDAGLAVLKAGAPKARLLVTSIPDMNQLWKVGRENTTVVRIWRLGVCPSLLANATSDEPADVARRREFAERVDAYNDALRDACRAYGKRCRYDGGAVHRVRLSLGLVNKLDYWHPDVDGQNKLAEVTYPRRFTW